MQSRASTTVAATYAALCYNTGLQPNDLPGSEIMRKVLFVPGLALALAGFAHHCYSADPTPIAGAPAAAVSFDLGGAVLSIDATTAAARVRFADGTATPKSDRPCFVLETAGRIVMPRRVVGEGDRLTVSFEDGSEAELRVSRQPGFAVFRLVRLDARSKVERLRLWEMPVPSSSGIAGTINAARWEGKLVAAMTAAPNVHSYSETTVAPRADRQGCSHRFDQTTAAKSGRYAARFAATCNKEPLGWSMRGTNFQAPRDLTGCKAIRAWVYGDGNGELLKFQLGDGVGGCRDNYLPIDFRGWRHVTLVESPVNNLRYDRVASLSFYYNSMPASKAIECRIDQVEAIVDRDGRERVVVLEDFESPKSQLWNQSHPTLVVESTAEHGIEPAAFGVLACRESEFNKVVTRFEVAAGLPSPRPGGEWNKTSPWIQRSYFFLTNFRQSQFDEALAIAQRGGFHMILLGQDSWCQSTGHFEVPRDRFPDGLPGLVATVDRFHKAGFRVGLHVLGASIDSWDPYVTPVPDRRLVHGATTTLAADVDGQATSLATIGPIDAFPEKDGGYLGDCTIVWIGDELIRYDKRSTSDPIGFTHCVRGHLGTKPASHKKGERVVHLVRSYGYHMFDLDTSMADEVASHFARVANAVRADMVYFDGSEKLQGDHWYYNAKLQKCYYDKLDNKNALFQASSYSPYSWHLMARSASADGHDDLKGYLDERSPMFDFYSRDTMPLDIGWYYGYDPMSTPDMYEYILGATIGYNSSLSFQVSPVAAAAHPFTREILDLIRRYERIRLSGRIPPEMRARLRIDPVLGGLQKPEQRAGKLDHRREYRLLGEEGHEVFQRVVYTPWHDIAPTNAAQAWTIDVPQGPARVGFQVHARPGPWLHAGPAYHDPRAVVLESFDDLSPYAPGLKSARPVRSIGPKEAGSTSPGVTQRIELSDRDAKEGRNCAIYSATGGPQADGWSALGKSFDPPLDLSWHRGIGFWLRGNGQGGQFKLQLGDGHGATDYYVANDYSGWRYHQLARPEKDPIDYRRVRSLTFYYNGLPAQTTASCAIDDVKALRSLDRRTISDPWVEIDGMRLKCAMSLGEGQYVFSWPGEPVARYGRLPGESTSLLSILASSDASAAAVGADKTLPMGKHEVRFGCRDALTMPVRVRVTLQPPEQYRVP